MVGKWVGSDRMGRGERRGVRGGARERQGGLGGSEREGGGVSRPLVHPLRLRNPSLVSLS